MVITWKETISGLLFGITIGLTIGIPYGEYRINEQLRGPLLELGESIRALKDSAISENKSLDELLNSLKMNIK